MNKLKNLLARLRRLLGKRSTPPEPSEPYAGVRQPLRKGPSGRSGAVALEEPGEG